jgi:hypothetical protein
VFAASFRVTGAWLDVARVDSLFLAFSLIVIYFVRGRKSITNALLAGIFAALAFLTKQTALILCLPILVFLFWRDWRHALVFLVASVLIVGTTTLVLDKIYTGWFSYYVFGLLSQQAQWIPLDFIRFWKNDLLDHLPFAIFFAIFFFAGRFKQDRHSFYQWLSILAGALAGTFVTRVKIGGYDNVLLPTYAIFSILFGLGLNGLLNIIAQVSAEHRGRVKIFIQVACLFQLLILAYNPYAQLPTKADREAGRYLVQFLSEVDGEVYLPDHGYLGTLAGKGTYAHHSAIWDVVRTRRQTDGKILLAESLSEAIRQQRFDVIILDSEANYCCLEIEDYYTRAGEVFQDQTSFFPVTGDRRRPTNIYIANRLK